MEENIHQSNIQAHAEAMSVELLVRRVLRGEVRVPSFQRGLRWDAKNVVDLFDSIYRGYPIGSFLFSNAYASAENISIGSKIISAPEVSSALWVVDGQQRITALTDALSRESTIPTRPDDPWLVFFDAITKKFHSFPKDQQIPSTWVPIRELLDASSLSEWVHNWSESGNADARSAVFDAGARVRQYQIPVYVVETKDEKFLREIFYRVNNYGQSLRWGEIHDAIFGQKDQKLTTLGQLADELEQFGMGRMEELQLLNCLFAYVGFDVTRNLDEHYQREGDLLKDAVSDSLPTLKRVLSFLKSSAEIPHLRLLPRSTPLPVLTRFFALHPEPNKRSQTLLTRWVWRVLIGRPLINERTLLRRAISNIDEGDEERSIQALIALVSKEKPPRFALPDMFDARSAQSRIVLIALSSLNPQDIYDGRQMDIPNLIETWDLSAFRKIVGEGELSRSPANRIFSSGGSGAFLKEIKQVSNQLDFGVDKKSIWHSHGISQLALDALLDNNSDEFLLLRKSEIENVIENLGDKLAAWKLSDRPSINYLIGEKVDYEESV